MQKITSKSRKWVPRSSLCETIYYNSNVEVTVKVNKDLQSSSVTSHSLNNFACFVVYFIQSAVVLGMERRHVISMKNAIALKNLLCFMGKSKNEKPRNEVSQAKENIGHNLFIFSFSNMFKTKIL